MKTLYTEEQYSITNSTDKLTCECYNCNSVFLITKKLITHELKHNRGRCKFCSQNCNNIYNNASKKKLVICLNCTAEFEKKPAEINKNNFCSRSCSATYNNKHKTHGTRRSKLEVYLEEQLSLLYPNLIIDYNQKSAINSELDIYVPSLKLAFELNGIFHYEPIYGSDKLNQIRNNDVSKSKACFDNHIDLCTIDASGLKYFKPSNAQKYLDIIVNIINQRTSC